MNYDWLEDSKVLNKGLLNPRCFYTLDPAYSQSLNGLWHIKFYHKAESPFNDIIQMLPWEKAQVPSYLELGVPPSDSLDSKTIPYPSDNSIFKKTFDCNFIGPRKKTIICFSAVQSAASFWLNGKFLGFSRGSYTEIEFDISEIIQLQNNELIVQVFSDGLNADHWNFTGILRDVSIYALPEKHIRDYHISTSWNEKTGAGFELSVDLEGDANVEVRIYDNDEVILVKDYFKDLTVKNLFLEPWSFENPKCYLLELCVLDSQNKVLQTISQFIGFRSITIIKGYLKFNGKYLTIRGLNHNEHNEKKQHVIDEENMLLDIRMMKAANINAVSNAGHVFHQKWYELCDKYGLLVIDSYSADLNKRNNYPEKHINNVQRMCHRSKNHTCVIAWNLGNEQDFSFHDSYIWSKSLDKSQLVLFSEGASRGLSDVHFPTFKSLKELKKYGKSAADRPTILSSYGDTHGNALGGFKECWNLMDKYDNLQGGFLDGFIDPGIKNKDGFWEYKSVQQIKGILLPDRIPHPSYFEIKKVFQGISFRLDRDEDLIVFRNNNLFEHTVGVIEIRIWTPKLQLFFQRRNFELPANSSELITYTLESHNYSESVFLDVKAFINNGEVAGEEQFILHKKTFEIPISEKPLKFPYAISPNVIRPPTQIEIIKNDSIADRSVPTIIPEFSEEYIDESTLKINMSCKSSIRLQRFGVKIYLPKIFSQVTYLGRGPHENYIDRKSSALWGKYYTTPEKMIPSYIIPQESAYRSENGELIISNLHGNGFKFSSKEDFGFSYLPFSPEQLSNEGEGQWNPLIIGQEESSEYILCIDAYMSGIGKDYKVDESDLIEEHSKYEFTLYISSV